MLDTDLRARKDRVNALGKLVARLPIEEYTLFRFLYVNLLPKIARSVTYTYPSSSQFRTPLRDRSER